MAGMERALPIRGLRQLVVDDYVLDYEISAARFTLRHGRQRDPYLEHDADFDYEADLGKT